MRASATSTTIRKSRVTRNWRPRTAASSSGTPGRLYDAKKKYLGRVWFFRDITEKKRAAEKIADAGAHRRADRAGQPRDVSRPAQSGIRARQTRRQPIRRALYRSRSFQGRQRHARPSGRRRAAARGRRTPESLRARDRHGRPLRRRRIRHAAGRRRERRQYRNAGGQDRRRPGDAIRDRRQSDSHHRQHRHRALPERHRRRRRHDDEGRSRALPRQERRPQPFRLHVAELDERDAASA